VDQRREKRDDRDPGRTSLHVQPFDAPETLDRLGRDPVRYRRLGASGPEISVIGYGGWEAGGSAWGANPHDDQVVDAIRAGFDAGINWVDTAEVYGSGRSEELIGRAIKRRPDVMVFTKVASAPRGTGYDPASVRRAAHASLERLGREVIDLYQLHWPDESVVPLEDTWASMAELADAGLVRWIGVSNFPNEVIARCEAVRHVDSLQPHLSMLWTERAPQLRYCRENGTGVIAYGPLAYGLLTGAITRDTTFTEDDWRGGGHGLRAYDQLFAPEVFGRNVEVVDGLRPIADRLGVSLAQLALAWVIHQEGATGAIAGSRSRSHVRENAQAGDVRLTAVDLSAIKDVIGTGR
jgi:aryl-alcohol dehydrogenase-like predicted oxidoreductase